MTVSHKDNMTTASHQFRARYKRLDEEKAEADARALFRKMYPKFADEDIERQWQDKDVERESCLEQARVKLDMESFWSNNGPDLVELYASKVNIFPDDLVGFEENEDAFLTELKQCQLLLLTANQVENRMLTHLLYQAGGRKKLRWCTLGNCTWTLADLGPIRAAHLVPLESGSHGREGSRNAVEQAQTYFEPTLVVSLGVAYGADVRTQRLGDVLVSSKILPSDAGKRVDGSFELRGDSYPTSSHVRARWEALLDSAMQPEARYGFRWYFGPMLSGSSVINDAEEKLRLLQAARDRGEKVVGGEMEGSGIYSICGEIPCIVIKGICDWAVLKNGWAEVSDEADNDQIKDCVQGFAAHHAFEALFYLLSRAPIGTMPIPKKECKPSLGSPVPLFCFHLCDVRELLVGGSVGILETNLRSDEAFLQALLPDYLRPADPAAMNGAFPEETICEFFRDRETSLRHILQKCNELLKGAKENALFSAAQEVLKSIDPQDKAGNLCRDCYLHCTAGRVHAERGLAVLTVFALLGPEKFQELLWQENYSLFCQ